jgi:hypothetical protein
MSANPRLSSAEVENILFSTAVDLGAAGRDIYFGHGRVNAAAAVEAALRMAPASDMQAPSVAISAPTGYSSVSGLVAVNATAADNVGVARVELRVNGSLVATDGTAPFAFSWDSTKVANGMASLTATAYDAAGNAGASAAVAVNVANSNGVVADTTPPSLTIRNPSDGSRVGTKVTITAAASDDSGTAGLKQVLLIDGRQVATATGGTLSYTWNTRKLSAGTHTVQVTATNAAGNRATQSVRVSK